VKAEKFKVVQLFEFQKALGRVNQTDKIYPSAFYKTSYTTNFTKGKSVNFGAAYMVKSDIYDQIGGLPDKCIAGCCDCLISFSAVDPLEYDVPEYKKRKEYLSLF